MRRHLTIADAVLEMRKLRYDAALLALKLADLRNDIIASASAGMRAGFFPEMDAAINQANVLGKIIEDAERQI
jgi:hypothetical protein